MSTEYQYCEVEHKRMYSRREAGAHINVARKNFRGSDIHKRKTRKITPQRCYLCPHCKHWHLTSSKNPYTG
jgi:hypothetical protein